MIDVSSGLASASRSSALPSRPSSSSERMRQTGSRWLRRSSAQGWGASAAITFHSRARLNMARMSQSSRLARPERSFDIPWNQAVTSSAVMRFMGREPNTGSRCSRSALSKPSRVEGFQSSAIRSR